MTIQRRCDARAWRYRAGGVWMLVQCRRRGYGTDDVALCPRHALEYVAVAGRVDDRWTQAPRGLLQMVDDGGATA